MAKARYGKPIRRATPEQRTYKDEVYATKMEMLYAPYLDELKQIGEVFRWSRQPLIRLGPDCKFSPDYLVSGYITDRFEIKYADVYCVDVKGYSQTGWTKKKKLWLKYAPMRLKVVELKNRRWHTIDIVDPAEGRK